MGPPWGNCLLMYGSLDLLLDSVAFLKGIPRPPCTDQTKSQIAEGLAIIPSDCVVDQSNNSFFMERFLIMMRFFFKLHLKFTCC
jgi:hypothetical protein